MASRRQLGAIAFIRQGVPLLVLSAVFVCGASAATPVRVSFAAKPSQPVAGRAWTTKLVVRPASFRGVVRVTARGARRIEGRATRRGGSYRVRLVFPAAGRWALSARAGGSSPALVPCECGRLEARFNSQSRRRSTSSRRERCFSSRTLAAGCSSSIPPRGTVTVVASGIDRPYAVVRAPSGAIFLSSSNVLRRIEGGTNTIVAEADRQIGPVTVGSNGDVYYATATRIFRLAGGVGPPSLIAGTGVEGGGGDGGPALAAQVSAPHGLGLTADGSLLVSDTENNRIRRIDLASGIITAFAEVQMPLGMDLDPLGRSMSSVGARAASST